MLKINAMGLHEDMFQLNHHVHIIITTLNTLLLVKEINTSVSLRDPRSNSDLLKIDRILAENAPIDKST